MSLSVKNRFFSNFICEGCTIGKQHRLPFAESKNRAKEPCEFIHNELQEPSLGRR